MAYKSLTHFIEVLEKNNELIRIKEYVNPELEITEITDRFSKSKDGGRALLFENTSSNFPVLINAFGSEKRICLALGVNNLDEIGKKIEDVFKDLSSPKSSILEKLKILPTLSNISSWMPRQISGKGICQEVIIRDPDLSELPILKCWPADGGPFITLPIVITKDPNNGIRNVGMYRMQVFEKDLTGMHWHKHKVGARHFEEYKEKGEIMPIAVALGGDPSYTYAATAPLPDNLDEFLLAGFLRNKRVDMVKCITQDIEVPADADIIIEGYIDPEEEFIWEGPFGDHTGFYSLADWYPKFHVTCITHKKEAVYPATIVGIPPMEDAWIGKATERIFLAPIKLAILPEIIDYDLPFEGVAHNISIVKIKKTYPGQAFKVINALWGAGQMMFNKIMIVVDQDIDIHNYEKLVEHVLKNTTPEHDIHFMSGPLDVLDHSSSKFTYGSKLGIDATIKLEEEINEENINQIKVNDPGGNILKRILEIDDIKNVNSYYDQRIIICSVKKENREQLSILAKKMSELKELNRTKFILFVDDVVDVHDSQMIAWLSSGNIDPKRDTDIIKSTLNSVSKIFIDATRKSLQKDNFKRDWPNVVISDEITVQEIDEKWNKLGLGEFLNSPSNKYMILNKSKGAVADE